MFCSLVLLVLHTCFIRMMYSLTFIWTKNSDNYISEWKTVERGSRLESNFKFVSRFQKKLELIVNLFFLFLVLLCTLCLISFILFKWNCHYKSPIRFLLPFDLWFRHHLNQWLMYPSFERSLTHGLIRYTEFYNEIVISFFREHVIKITNNLLQHFDFGRISCALLV